MTKPIIALGRLIAFTKARLIPTSKTIHRSDRVITSNRSLSKIEQLPPEILLIILNESLLESGVALSLTSKHLYNILFHESLRDICPLTRLYLLQLLERDLPQYYVCTACIHLYRWESSAALYACPGRELEPSITGNHTKPARLDGTNRPKFLTVEQRNLILRAAKRGPEYGPPISCLENNFKSTAMYGIEMHKLYVPRISNDSLMLWRTVTIVIDLRADVPSQVACLWEATCEHTSPNVAALCKCAISHLDLQSARRPRQTRVNGERPRCLQLLKCPFCPTDMQVEVHWLTAKSRDNVLMRVHSWMDFGNAETDPYSFQGGHFSYTSRVSRRRRTWDPDTHLHKNFGSESNPVRWKMPTLIEKTQEEPPSLSQARYVKCTMDRPYGFKYFMWANG